MGSITIRENSNPHKRSKDPKRRSRCMNSSIRNQWSQLPNFKLSHDQEKAPPDLSTLLLHRCCSRQLNSKTLMKNWPGKKSRIKLIRNIRKS
jgi:hypothetical protein